MINDIFSRVPNHFGKSLFADDGAVRKRGRNLHVIVHQMQKALDQDVECANDWGFRISSFKSKCMIFGNKREIPALIFCCMTVQWKELKSLSVSVYGWIKD